MDQLLGTIFNGAVTMRPLDALVFLTYLIVLMVIGGWVSYRERKSEDLFLGDRSMGWFNIGMSLFGTNVGPTFLLATCGAGYTTGMVTANYEWMAWIFLLLLGMAFVPFYMQTKISTMPEFLNKRFGGSCYDFMSVYALFGIVVLWIGGTLFAGGALLGQLLGWDLMTSIWVLAIISTSFTVTGGLVAIMVTDSYQSLLMIIGAGLLSLIMYMNIDSFETLKNIQVGTLPRELTWKLFRPGDSGDPWYAFLLGYPVLSLWFWCSDQTIVQRVLGARNLKQGQLGTLFMGYLKIFPPFIFLFPGIFAAALVPGIADDKQVYLLIVDKYMPAGLVGLTIAVLVSAVVTTLDAGLNSFSTIFTLDIYKRWFVPDASNLHTKRAGQIVTIFAALMAVAIAWRLSRVEGSSLFNLFQGIIGYLAPPISAVFVLGVFWKRATTTGAFVTLIFGSLISISIGLCDINDIFVREIAGVKTDIWPHFLLLSFYLFAALLALMVIVSLLTPHSASETPLPTLRETYQANPGMTLKAAVIGWGSLAVIMLCLYLFFHFAMS